MISNDRPLGDAELMSPPAPQRAAPPTELPPRLRCEGGQIIKPNGEPILLHGPCFGSWGEDSADDCPSIKRMGANNLRINLRWHGKWGTDARANPDSRDNDAFALINRAKFQTWAGQVRAAGAAQLWTNPFIDSNCGQSGTNTPEDIAYCDPYGSWGAAGHNFYTDPSLRRIFATVVWRAVAEYLRTLPYVGQLEIHPEPAHHRDETWSPLVAQVQKECIDAIREAEAAMGDPVGTPILVGAREGYDNRYVEEAINALADAYGGSMPGNLIWTGNLLNQFTVDPKRFDKAVARFVKWREQYGVPFYVQQLGRNSSEDPGLKFMARAIQVLRDNEIGYAWWQWKQNTANPGNMGLWFKDENDPSGMSWIAKTDEQALLADDWGGVPPTA